MARDYYYVCQRLNLEGETENMGVCTEEREGGTAGVLMATPCTKMLMLVRSAAALATMRPVLLLRVL